MNWPIATGENGAQKRPEGVPMIDAATDEAIVAALHGQDLSGAELWRWLAADHSTPRLLTEADLYPTLYRLEAEGLLRSDWQEGERTRRTYRLTPLGKEQAAGSGLPQGAATATTHVFSPDPDSGTWFVPPRAEPAPEPQKSAGTAQVASSISVGAAEGAISAFSAELDGLLDLPRVERERICQEIGDHIRDSVAAAASGDPEATRNAAAEAVGRLGGASGLAARIQQAEQTPARLRRARRGAVGILVSEMLVWAIVSGVVLVVTPGIADFIVGIGGLAGLHLVVLEPGEWFSSQIALTLCIGAFATGRISLGYLARASRHRDETVRRRWAGAGAAVLLLTALLIPFYQDPISVLLMLAIPAAFVLGTMRTRQSNDPTFSVKGVAAAAAVMLIACYMPGVRLFAYDTNATPDTSGAPTEAGAVTWTQQPNGGFTYTVTPAQPGVVAIEIWPASKHWLTIGPDASASARNAAPVGGTAAATTVDFSHVPAAGQWWVAAVRADPGSPRTAIDAKVQTGASGGWGNLLGWLIGRF
jgi:hypothetical protein